MRQLNRGARFGFIGAEATGHFVDRMNAVNGQTGFDSLDDLVMDTDINIWTGFHYLE